MNADLKKGLAIGRRMKAMGERDKPGPARLVLGSWPLPEQFIAEKLIARMKEHGWYETTDHRITHKDHPGVFWYDSWHDAVLGCIDMAAGK